MGPYLDRMGPYFGKISPNYDRMVPNCGRMSPSYEIMGPSCEIMGPSYEIMGPFCEVIDPNGTRSAAVKQRLLRELRAETRVLTSVPCNHKRKPLQKSIIWNGKAA